MIGVVPGADAIDVPLPGERDGIEREEPFIGQRREELDREERIATGLRLHEFRLKAARSGGQRRASATSRPISSSPTGASTTSWTRPPAPRIASSVRRSGCAGPTSLSR